MNTATLFSSATGDWHTPPSFLAHVYAVLGCPIDTDPCSAGEGRDHVQARYRYTMGDDSLHIPCWSGGTVFMNPPYGREIGHWVEKLVGEYKAGHFVQAIALLPARPDTRWFQLLAEYPLCFWRGRLKFSGHADSAPFPSVVAYLGPNPARFAAVFGPLGLIMQCSNPAGVP